MPHKRAKRSTRESQRAAAGHDLAPEKNGLSFEGIPKGIARVLNAATIRAEWKARKRGADDEHHDGRAKKRRKSDNQESTKGGQKSDGSEMSILPGESLTHFNRRVESNMRPLVRTAMSASSAQQRKVKKEEEEAKSATNAAKAANNVSKKQSSRLEKDSDEEEVIKKEKSSNKEKKAPEKLASTIPPQRIRATEFATADTSTPRRLNDVAMAPPTLSRVPRTKPSDPNRNSDTTNKKSLADGVLSMAQKAMMEQERERAIQRYRELKERRSVKDTIDT